MTFQKHTDGKPATHLLPPGALLAASEALAYGAVKYGEGNWRKCPPEDAMRVFGAALHRHYLLAARALEDYEEPIDESGIPHTAHIIANALILHELLGRLPVSEEDGEDEEDDEDEDEYEDDEDDDEEYEDEEEDEEDEEVKVEKVEEVKIEKVDEVPTLPSGVLDMLMSRVLTTARAAAPARVWGVTQRANKVELAWYEWHGPLPWPAHVSVIALETAKVDGRHVVRGTYENRVWVEPVTAPINQAVHTVIEHVVNHVRAHASVITLAVPDTRPATWERMQASNLIPPGVIALCSKYAKDKISYYWEGKSLILGRSVGMPVMSVRIGRDTNWWMDTPESYRRVTLAVGDTPIELALRNLLKDPDEFGVAGLFRRLLGVTGPVCGFKDGDPGF